MDCGLTSFCPHLNSFSGNFTCLFSGFGTNFNCLNSYFTNSF